MTSKDPAPEIQDSDFTSHHAPIGVFDSGIGGLTIFRALRGHLPNETLYYLADQAHVPYGSQSMDKIQHLGDRLTRFLLSSQVNLILVAYNTTSAAALRALRTEFPTIPFVGMEPAGKPATSSSQAGFVGILATPTSFRGKPYGSLLDRFDKEVTVLADTYPGLVNQIEEGGMENIAMKQSK